MGLALADRGSRWAGQIVGLALAVAGVGLVVSLSVSLVSPSRASRRHGVAALPLRLALSVSHSPSRRGSLTFLSSFFFSFFSFGF